MSAMQLVAAETSVDIDLDRTREKFLRLLEMDRSSSEFMTLYAEVDAEISAAMLAESGQNRK